MKDGCKADKDSGLHRTLSWHQVIPYLYKLARIVLPQSSSSIKHAKWLASHAEGRPYLLHLPNWKTPRDHHRRPRMKIKLHHFSDANTQLHTCEGTACASATRDIQGFWDLLGTWKILEDLRRKSQPLNAPISGLTQNYRTESWDSDRGTPFCRSLRIAEVEITISKNNTILEWNKSD